jgi:hypothetical protein
MTDRLTQALGPAGIDPESSYGKLLIGMVKLADDLLKETGDIRSVAIVVDYNMPDPAQANLPPGIWLSKGEPTVHSATNILAPLSRMHRMVAMGVNNTIVQQQQMALSPKEPIV